jgi:hypothetical protein
MGVSPLRNPLYQTTLKKKLKGHHVLVFCPARKNRAKYSIVNDLLILGGFFVGFVRRTHDDKLF